jgi:hypothetical protein
MTPTRGASGIKRGAIHRLAANPIGSWTTIAKSASRTASSIAMLLRGIPSGGPDHRPPR